MQNLKFQTFPHKNHPTVPVLPVATFCRFSKLTKFNPINLLECSSSVTLFTQAVICKVARVGSQNPKFHSINQKCGKFWLPNSTFLYWDLYLSTYKEKRRSKVIKIRLILIRECYRTVLNWLANSDNSSITSMAPKSQTALSHHHHHHPCSISSHLKGWLNVTLNCFSISTKCIPKTFSGCSLPSEFSQPLLDLWAPLRNHSCCFYATFQTAKRAFGGDKWTVHLIKERS